LSILKVAKFYTQVEYNKCWPCDDRLLLMGVVQSIAPIVSLEFVKLRQFKFRVLIDILLHQRMCLALTFGK